MQQRIFPCEGAISELGTARAAHEVSILLLHGYAVAEVPLEDNSSVDKLEKDAMILLWALGSKG